MFVRMTTIQGKPEKLQDAISVVENDVIPAAKVMKGFKRGYWLADRSSGKMIALTMFDSKSDLEASEAAATQVRQGSTEKLAFDVLDVERFEIVAEI